MIRIAHLITSLDVGGAETMLVRLAGRMDATHFESHVISLLPAGPLAGPLEREGVPVTSLGLRRGQPNPVAVLRLARQLRHLRPRILQTWLYHADVLGTLAAPLAHVPALLWNIRASDVDMAHYGAVSSATRRAAAWLSRRPNAIVVNSAAGQSAHEALGYRPRRWLLVPNGIDCDRFRPDPEARAEVRHELRIPAAAPVIGLIARFHPMKGHHVFVKAMAPLCRARPDVHVLLAGAGTDARNGELRAWIAAGGLEGRLALLGPRDDVAALNAALDVAVMASTDGEGFPTALAEAMACGVPCVGTDVGDARRLIADTGRVVPPRDPDALAGACRELLDLPAGSRAELARQARARILEEFELGRIVRAYEAIYSSC